MEKKRISPGIVLLHWQSGLCTADIAQKMDTPEAEVYRVLRDALDRRRRAFRVKIDTPIPPVGEQALED